MAADYTFLLGQEQPLQLTKSFAVPQVSVSESSSSRSHLTIITTTTGGDDSNGTNYRDAFAGFDNFDDEAFLKHDEDDANEDYLVKRKRSRTSPSFAVRLIEY